MDTLCTQDFALACRLFMERAYPGGVQTVPERLRLFCDISPERPIDDFMPASPLCNGIAQDLAKAKTGILGFAYRLGSTKHPHLKLRVQRMDFQQRDVWVYSVDTHDRFHRAIEHPNEEEAAAWRQLCEQNRQLKHQIEEALAQAGFLTPKTLLKLDLTSPA